MSSNVHIGHNRWLSNNKIKPFLIGYKHSLNFINLYYTNLQLKLLINFIYNTTSLRQKILIVNEFGSLNFNNLFSNLRNVFYIKNKWTGGSLTNFKLVRRNSQNSLKNMKFMPSIVILFDSTLSKTALFECLNLEIPTSVILDSNSPFLEIINYPIIGNNRSVESLYFYSYLFRNAILKGVKKECLNILQIV